MPASNSLAISKFLGKDRYEHYVQELTGYGTVGGTQLSPAQRKQAFKVRANKVQFEKFVDTLLAKKAAAVKTKPAGQIAGMKPFAFSRTQNAKAYSDQMISKFGDPLAAAAGRGGGALVRTSGGELTEIANGLGGILTLFKEEQKVKKDTAELDRKKKEEEKRKLLKSRLKKGFEKIKKVAEKVLAPVKGLLQRIIDFIMTIFIGRFLYRLLEWWGDPANKEKVDSIIRFFGDHWPKLLTLYIAFGTSFGRFAIGLSKAVFKGAIKLGFAIAKLLAAKKVKGAMGAARFLGGGKAKLFANVLGTTLAVGGTYAAVNAMKGDGGDQKTQGFSGGGLAMPRFAGGGFNLASLFGSLGKMGGAGAAAFSGFVSGEKGVDKVPAMLSDGEFVMSRGAVDMYGVDTLEQMNAAGGGTNKPKVMGGTTYAAGGGLVGKSNLLNNRSKLIYDTLVGRGMTPIAAGGILANLGVETGYTYDPNTHQGGGGPGRGLAQWEKGGRYDTDRINLLSFAKSIGKPWNDLMAQIGFIMHEFTTHPEYKSVKSALNSAKSINDATLIFLRRYEKAGTPHTESRLAVARQILDNYINKKSKPTTASTKPQPQPSIMDRVRGFFGGGNRDMGESPNKKAYFHGGLVKYQDGGMVGPSWLPWNWGKVVDQHRNTKSTDYTNQNSFLARQAKQRDMMKEMGYQTGGPVQFSPTSRPKPRITPLPKPSSNVSMMQLPDMGGGYGMPSSPGGSSLPSFSASSGGSDRLNKIKTLGIGA